MSWSRYEGWALAQTASSAAARDAELADFIRLQNPHLTDIRVELATTTESYDTSVRPARRWYHVAYLGDDGQGHFAEE